MREQLEAIGIGLTKAEEDVHYNFLLKRQPYDNRYKEWIRKLIFQNNIHKKYSEEQLGKLLWKKWAETSYFELAKSKNPIKIIKILFNIPFKYWSELLKIRKNRQKKEW